MNTLPLRIFKPRIYLLSSCLLAWFDSQKHAPTLGVRVKSNGEKTICSSFCFFSKCVFVNWTLGAQQMNWRTLVILSRVEHRCGFQENQSPHKLNDCIEYLWHVCMPMCENPTQIGRCQNSCEIFECVQCRRMEEWTRFCSINLNAFHRNK